jgi:hypothetical protein
MSIARCIAGTVLGCALLITPYAQAADDSINEEARKHFSAGVSLLQDPDGARYEDAYREFEAAYSASLSPKILGNIGYCALKLERDGEAIAAYTRYLQEVRDVDPAEATQITRDVATLRAGLVRVTVTVDAPDGSVIDKRMPVRGDSVTNLYSMVNGKVDLGLRPGHHIIEVKARGETQERWEFDAKPGATLSRAVTVKTPGEPVQKSSSHTVPWLVTGVGSATLVAGGIVGAMTLGKVTSISNNCPNDRCPSNYALKPAQDDARRFIRITDTLLIGGGVITVAGIWLFFAMSGPESSHPPSSTARTQSPQPWLSCSASGCVAAMNGAF